VRATALHEYSIVGAMIARIETEARDRNAVAVRRVRVRIGELSGVDPDLLATAYTIFRERSVCEGAELSIERVQARWQCAACGEAGMSNGYLRCRICGGAANLVQGDEIILQQIEMEVE
jgi:hydrogenase nickel incorporation protein HypA/HybF